MRRKAANRGAVKGQVVIAPDQELLVIVQQVQAAFEIAEQNGDSLDAFFIRQILQTRVADLVRRYTVEPVALGLKIEFLQLLVSEG